MSASRPKSCSHCQAPLCIHLTKVVDGKKAKLGVCADCPKAEAIKSGKGWDLVGKEDGGATPKKPQAQDIACPGCGLTPADFKEKGRLGCSQCYETFEAKLEPVIRKLHRGPSHLGKAPGGKRRRLEPEEVEALKRRLEEHVSREEYELAAVVRDQLNSLEA